MFPWSAPTTTALKAFDADAVPGFVSLEGYLPAGWPSQGSTSAAVISAGSVSLDAIRGAGSIEIEGLVLEYGPSDNQGSDAVFLTVIGADGSYRLVEELEGVRKMSNVGMRKPLIVTAVVALVVLIASSVVGWQALGGLADQSDVSDDTSIPATALALSQHSNSLAFRALVTTNLTWTATACWR